MDKLLYEIEGSFKSNKFIKSDIVNIMINFRLFLDKKCEEMKEVYNFFHFCYNIEKRVKRCIIWKK